MMTLSKVAANRYEFSDNDFVFVPAPEDEATYNPFAVEELNPTEAWAVALMFARYDVEFWGEVDSKLNHVRALVRIWRELQKHGTVNIG